MKKNHTITLLLLLSLPSFGNCNQDSYYRGLSNKSNGFSLKSAISTVISKSHKNLSYGGLLSAYKKTDRDTTYNADNSLMDIYSENPSGNDPYSYKAFRKSCGQYRKEGDCYNREHLFPQGLFGKQRPMRTDILHVYPTDGKVNGMRGSYPFGEVSTPTWSSENGSKLGPSSNPLYSGTVFEPIDEFKGDIARAMLYFAVRYESQIPNFKKNPMTDGSYEQTYSTWFLQTLLKWHKEDPVSEHERLRNDAACNYQKNRNPFIDHPEWAMAIWEVN